MVSDDIPPKRKRSSSNASKSETMLANKSGGQARKRSKLTPFHLSICKNIKYYLICMFTLELPNLYKLMNKTNKYTTGEIVYY